MPPWANDTPYAPYASQELYDEAQKVAQQKHRQHLAAQELARRAWNRELDECTPTWREAILADAEAILAAADAAEEVVI